MTAYLVHLAPLARFVIESSEGGNTAQKKILDKLSIYIPEKKMKRNPVERLIKLADECDRSVNYLVVEAILEYLDREEKRD